MNYIENILKEQGRSKTWLADKMGVTYKTVLNWCRERTPLTERKVKDISAHLNVEPKEIKDES